MTPPTEPPVSVETYLFNLANVGLTGPDIEGLRRFVTRVRAAQREAAAPSCTCCMPMLDQLSGISALLREALDGAS